MVRAGVGSRWLGLDLGWIWVGSGLDLVAPDHLSGVMVRKWPAQGRAEALAARVDEHGAAALEERLGEPVGARRGEAHLGFGVGLRRRRRRRRRRRLRLWLRRRLRVRVRVKVRVTVGLGRRRRRRLRVRVRVREAHPWA